MSERMKKVLTNVALLLICLACALRWLYIGLIASRPTVYLFDCIVGLLWLAGAVLSAARAIRSAH
ncbi:hypothetical protein [Dysosmobacter sp. Sow4_B12]|uniref:hypothetical protein n=1 Tax=Dysosmobacter sp. Sow4_B12 TaxID=3438777 RepID=UPI003F9286CD